ncbi:unnamed protein product [Debaryomyces tyrocola]|nr:unnamed protein product [Debaryomyces tyrocola]
MLKKKKNYPLITTVFPHFITWDRLVHISTEVQNTTHYENYRILIANIEISLSIIHLLSRNGPSIHPSVLYRHGTSGVPAKYGHSLPLRNRKIWTAASSYMPLQL